jgi:hypothetical protein
MYIIHILILYLFCNINSIRSQITTPDGYFDGTLFPGQGLLSNSPLATTDTSWCFQTPERVIYDRLVPKYPEILVQAYLGTSNMGVIWHHITKIITEELFGYRVIWYDSSALPNPLNTFLTPSIYNDTNIVGSYTPDSGYSETYNNYLALYAQYVGTNKLLQNVGSMSSLDLTGIFVDYQTILSNPSLNLLHWTSYCKGTPYYPDYPDLFIQYTPERDAVISANIDALKNNSWSFVSSGLFAQWNNDPYFGLSCPTDEFYHAQTGLYAGCNDPNFPSMFVPPQCYPDPMSQCVIWLDINPIISGSIYASMVMSFNLSVVIGYVGYEFFVSSLTLNASIPINVASSSQFPTGYSLCDYTDPLTGLTLQVSCYRLIDFPRFDISCLSGYTGSWNSTFLCGQQDTTHLKLVRSDLAVTAPRVNYLLQQMDFNTIASNQMIHNNGTDLRLKACVWLHSNRNVWESWINPPADCTINDFNFTATGCDEDTSTQRFDYYWNLPKACINGVSLPGSQEFSCGYFNSNNANVFKPFLIFGIIIIGIFILLPIIAYMYLYKGLYSKLFPDYHIYSYIHYKEKKTWLLWMIMPICAIVTFISLLFDVTDNICQLRIQCYWLFVQTLFTGCYGQLIIKLWFKFQNKIIITDNIWNYIQLGGSVFTGVIMIILFAVDIDKPWVQYGTTNLAGDYNFQFQYCRMPSSWVLWIALIFMIINWAASLLLTPYLYPRYLHTQNKLRTHKNSLYYNLSASIWTCFVCHLIIIISMFFYTNNPTSPNDINTHLYIWLIVLLIMCAVLVYALQLHKVFNKSISYLLLRSKYKIAGILILITTDRVNELPLQIRDKQTKVYRSINYDDIEDVISVITYGFASIFQFKTNYIRLLHASLHNQSIIYNYYNNKTYEFIDDTNGSELSSINSSIAEISDVKDSNIKDPDSYSSLIITDATTELATLQKILSDPVTQVKFRQMLESKLKSENLKFLTTMKRYQRILFEQRDLHTEILIEESQYIRDNFIIDDSKEWLNISDVMRNTYLNAYKFLMSNLPNVDIVSLKIRCEFWWIHKKIINEIVQLIERNDVLEFNKSIYGLEAMSLLEQLKSVSTDSNKELKQILKLHYL